MSGFDAGADKKIRPMKKSRNHSVVTNFVAAFAFFALCGISLLAQDSRSGDGALIKLLKKIDSQATPDSYSGENHQKWVDARLAKLTEK